jgi:hypothetical protein
MVAWLAMHRSKSSLGREDLLLLHEALSYARKRAHLPAEVIRLQGVLERIEELILRLASSEPDGTEESLRLSPPEQEVLEKEIQRYCEALTQRGASPEGVEVAARLREVLARLTGRGRGFWGKRGRG